MKQTFLFLMLSWGLLACSETTPNNTMQDNTAEMPAAGDQTSQENSRKELDLPAIINAYLDVKESLVNSNPEDVIDASSSLYDHVEKSAAFKASVKALAESKELEAQRKQFEVVSNELYELVKNSEELPQTLYWQYCPMAFNNAGAYWLSGEKKIQNPYFGDKMLSCGSVKETLQ